MAASGRLGGGAGAAESNAWTEVAALDYMGGRHGTIFERGDGVNADAIRGDAPLASLGGGESGREEKRERRDGRPHMQGRVRGQEGGGRACMRVKDLSKREEGEDAKNTWQSSPSFGEPLFTGSFHEAASDSRNILEGVSVLGANDESRRILRKREREEESEQEEEERERKKRSCNRGLCLLLEDSEVALGESVEREDGDTPRFGALAGEERRNRVKLTAGIRVLTGGTDQLDMSFRDFTQKARRRGGDESEGGAVGDTLVEVEETQPWRESCKRVRTAVKSDKTLEGTCPYHGNGERLHRVDALEGGNEKCEEDTERYEWADEGDTCAEEVEETQRIDFPELSALLGEAGSAGEATKASYGNTKRRCEKYFTGMLALVSDAALLSGSCKRKRSEDGREKIEYRDIEAGDFSLEDNAGHRVEGETQVLEDRERSEVEGTQCVEAVQEKTTDDKESTRDEEEDPDDIDNSRHENLRVAGSLKLKEDGSGKVDVGGRRGYEDRGSREVGKIKVSPTHTSHSDLENQHSLGRACACESLGEAPVTLLRHHHIVNCTKGFTESESTLHVEANLEGNHRSSTGAAHEQLKPVCGLDEVEGSECCQRGEGGGDHQLGVLAYREVGEEKEEKKDISHESIEMLCKVDMQHRRGVGAGDGEGVQRESGEGEGEVEGTTKKEKRGEGEVEGKKIGEKLEEGEPKNGDREGDSERKEEEGECKERQREREGGWEQVLDCSNGVRNCKSAEGDDSKGLETKIVEERIMDEVKPADKSWEVRLSLDSETEPPGEESQRRAFGIIDQLIPDSYDDDLGHGITDLRMEPGEIQSDQEELGEGLLGMPILGIVRGLKKPRGVSEENGIPFTFRAETKGVRSKGRGGRGVERMGKGALGNPIWHANGVNEGVGDGRGDGRGDVFFGRESFTGGVIEAPTRDVYEWADSQHDKREVKVGDGSKEGGRRHGARKAPKKAQNAPENIRSSRTSLLGQNKLTRIERRDSLGNAEAEGTKKTTYPNGSRQKKKNATGVRRVGISLGTSVEQNNFTEFPASNSVATAPVSATLRGEYDSPIGEDTQVALEAMHILGNSTDLPARVERIEGEARAKKKEGLRMEVRGGSGGRVELWKKDPKVDWAEVFSPKAREEGEENGETGMSGRGGDVERNVGGRDLKDGVVAKPDGMEGNKPRVNDGDRNAVIQSKEGGKEKEKEREEEEGGERNGKRLGLDAKLVGIEETVNKQQRKQEAREKVMEEENGAKKLDGNWKRKNGGRVQECERNEKVLKKGRKTVREAQRRGDKGEENSIYEGVLVEKRRENQVSITEREVDREGEIRHAMKKKTEKTTTCREDEGNKARKDKELEVKGTGWKNTRRQASVAEGREQGGEGVGEGESDTERKLRSKTKIRLVPEIQTSSEGHVRKGKRKRFSSVEEKAPKTKTFSNVLSIFPRSLNLPKSMKTAQTQQSPKSKKSPKYPSAPTSKTYSDSTPRTGEGRELRGRKETKAIEDTIVRSRQRQKRLSSSRGLSSGKVMEESEQREVDEEEAEEWISPSQDRRKDVRVLFSHSLPKEECPSFTLMVNKLGGKIASNPSECTHFVVEKFGRTVNMMIAIARGCHVVTPEWLESCREVKRFVDPGSFILQDARKEREFGFSLRVALAEARQRPVLQGWRVYIAPHTTPAPKELSEIATAAGAKIVKTYEGPPAEEGEEFPCLVLAGEADRHHCRPLLTKRASVYSAEFLMSAVLLHRIDFSKHRMFYNQRTKKSRK